MLMTHYREPIDFSVARLQEAEEKLKGWQRLASAAPRDAAHEPDPSVLAELADDLNFHRASVALDVIARKAAPAPRQRCSALPAPSIFSDSVAIALLQQPAEEGDESAAVEAFVTARLAALASKDFAKADTIRADLAAQGIQLMDFKDPATGERRTKWEMKR